MICQKCGAHKGTLGLEPTPDLYVQHLVEIFREVKRVLRDDGTVWLNLGDCYHSGNRGGYHRDWERGYFGGEMQKGNQGSLDAGLQPNRLSQIGLKDKDLVGMPWRVAFALQADGWWLRSDIIWSKPNPMPESVTDRPTKSHEFLFLLTKSARYYYDAEAIKEPLQTDPDLLKARVIAAKNAALHNRVPDDVARIDRYAATTEAYAPIARNRRTVWEIATSPFPDAHFATFPQALVKPCILAGSPLGGIVLDPFAGSGTAVLVAQELGRVGIGVELKADYLAMARDRTRQRGLL